MAEEKLIASFAVDHTNLKPGIYVSRQDTFQGAPITTYDIRMTSPNQEPAMAPAAIHTIEHIIATWLRNNPIWSDRVVYWGPMGCLTGMYLIMHGSYTPQEIRQLMIDAYQHLAQYDGPVPGAYPACCGNYLMHDLPMAKWEAKRYVQRLQNDFHCQYPNVQRPTDQSGATFYDA